MRFIPHLFLIVAGSAVLISMVFLSTGSVIDTPFQLTGEPASEQDIRNALNGDTGAGDLEERGIGCSFVDETGQGGLFYAKRGDIRAMAATSSEPSRDERRPHLLVVDGVAWIWYDTESDGVRFILRDGSEVNIPPAGSVATTSAATTSVATNTVSVTRSSRASRSIFSPADLSRAYAVEQLLSESASCYTMSILETLFQVPALVDFEARD